MTEDHSHRTAQSGARRMPTASQLGIWRDFVETSMALQSELSRRMQEESGLSPADYAVLLALSEERSHELRSSELADTITWERSRLSHHLRRMESRGLIRRDNCATDSRGAVVVLTDEGSSAFRRSNIPHLRAIRELFIDHLSDEQLQMVDDITRALKTPAESPTT